MYIEITTTTVSSTEWVLILIRNLSFPIGPWFVPRRICPSQHTVLRGNKTFVLKKRSS